MQPARLAPLRRCLGLSIQPVMVPAFRSRCSALSASNAELCAARLLATDSQRQHWLESGVK